MGQRYVPQTMAFPQPKLASIRSLLQLRTQCIVQTGSAAHEVTASSIARTAMEQPAQTLVSVAMGNNNQIELIQMEQIQALRFDVEEVGKHVKGSKKRYCWEIALKDKPHTIVLDFSFISGKIKITVDRKILLENELPADVSFQYPFTLDGFALNIIQQGESFELRINNKVFSHLYTQQRTNTEFKKYEDEVKDIKVDIAQMNPQGKKISLNIGAFGGGMKKKKQSSGGETNSWNAFAGGSFPSYFGEAPPETAKPEKQAEPPKKNLLDDEEETAVAAKTANEFNLLQTEKVEAKPSGDIFELISNDPPTSTQPTNTSQDFGNMQEMFSSLTVSNNKANELDFFADQPKSTIITKEPQAKPAPKPSPPTFDFSQPAPGLSGFGTGFGLEGVAQLNAKSFATMSNTNIKGFDMGSLDFTVNAPKQETVSAFSKKSSAQEGAYSPMDQLFAGQITNNTTSVSPPAPAIVNQTPNINDFNTMQLMFQTNSFGTAQQDFNFGQTLPQPTPTLQPKQPTLATQLPSQFTSTQQFQGNQDDFSTSMMRMFQTTSSQAQTQPQPQSQPQVTLNLSAPVQPIPPKQPQQNPLGLFSNNSPTTFATMGGLSLPQSFDINTFGTMQPGSKGGLELNFFDTKPSQPVQPAQKVNSGDLI